jgi:hypothetical protein
VSLILAGQWTLGFGNLFGSAVLGALAVTGGIALGRWL